MEVGEIFRRNVEAVMKEDGWNAAQLSEAAGMNKRLITDIIKGRSENPKLSTAFAICRALKRDPAEMLGLGPRHHLNERLATFLEQYSEADQERLLQALEALPLLPRE